MYIVCLAEHIVIEQNNDEAEFAQLCGTFTLFLCICDPFPSLV